VLVSTWKVKSFVPLLLIVTPPPPVEMAGWLFESVLLLKIRSSALPLAALSTKLKRSPRAEVNVVFCMVARTLPVVSDSRRIPSSPLLVLFAPMVSFEKVTRLTVLLVLSMRTLFEMPPLMNVLEIVAEPARLSILIVPSLNGDAALAAASVPLVPLSTLLSSVKPVTLVPRIP